MSQTLSPAPACSERARPQPTASLEGRTGVVFGGTSGIGLTAATQAK